MAEILTVSALNVYVKSLLDSDFNLSNIALEGELSNFKKYPSGHCYFTLKDSSSQIKGVMFSSYSRNLNFMPDSGMKVIVRGTVSLYERDGAYQIYVTDMFRSGDGAYRIAFERLKNKLESEGLFSKEHKKKKPDYPFKIGIVTSPKGAALHDIISVVERRFPCVEILLSPCAVQGESAPDMIVEAIKRLDAIDDVELIIITRGGGSKEDLWCFNDEKIARRAYRCKKPTISAIGHEIDVSILDFVCDYRAATPTRAAEMALPDIYNLNMQVSGYEKIISNSIKMKIDSEKLKLSELKSSRGFKSFENSLSDNSNKLSFLQTSFSNLIKNKIEYCKKDMISYGDKIENLSPMNNLKRGYSLIFDSEKNIIKSGFEKGDSIFVVTADKELDCTVNSVTDRKV